VASVGATDLPETLSVWKRPENPILFLQSCDACVESKYRECRGHVSDEPSNTGRHELTAHLELKGKRPHEMPIDANTFRLAYFQSESLKPAIMACVML